MRCGPTLLRLVTLVLLIGAAPGAPRLEPAATPFARLTRPLAAIARLLGPAPAAAAWEAPVRGENGMIATAHPLATEAGLEILRAGGNAVDAAVTATFVLGVVEPFSSGIGGGGFMLVHQRLEDETLALDFREQAPIAASRDMYVRGGRYVPELSRAGWLSVGTPGAVAGLLQALERWGSFGRDRVLARAIELAEQGFEVTPRYREAALGTLEILRADPEAARIFLVPGAPGGPAQVPPLGHRIVQKDLAQTLRRIRDAGAAGFYAGPVAAALATDSAARGGLLSLEDLSAYRPTERRPVRGRYRGYVIESMPPPSSGGVVLVETLNVLSRYDLSRDGWRSPRALHLIVETLKRAYADRNTRLGDPAFVKNPVERLTSLDYADDLRRHIDPLAATPSARIRSPAPEADGGMETSHVSVVDAAGNAVSLTNTLNYAFGSGVVPKGTGVLLNNEMDDFAAVPGEANLYGLVQGEANAIAPRKIPLSSMTPTLVFREGADARRLYMVLGAPGGPTIITTVLQILLNVVLFDMDLAQAVGASRVHHQWLPDRLYYEPYGLDAATLDALGALGHETAARGTWGNAQCILVDPETEVRYGASDPRGEGLAAGF